MRGDFPLRRVFGRFWVMTVGVRSQPRFIPGYSERIDKEVVGLGEQARRDEVAATETSLKEFMENMVGGMEYGKYAETLGRYVEWLGEKIQLEVTDGDVRKPNARYEGGGKDWTGTHGASLIEASGRSENEARQALRGALEKHVTQWEKLSKPLETAERIKDDLLGSYEW